MKRVFLDTNIIIDFVNKKSEILGVLEKKSVAGELELVINPIVVAEFFTDQAVGKEKFYEEMLQLIGLFSMIPITKEIGLLAGSYLREKFIPFIGDAFIAATCIEEDCLLATRNTKHFQKVSGLKFYTEK